jgi:hypothetical protein
VTISRREPNDLEDTTSKVTKPVCFDDDRTNVLGLLFKGVVPSERLKNESSVELLALFTAYRPGDDRNALDIDQQTLDLAEAAVKIRCGVDAQADAERINILPPSIVSHGWEPAGLCSLRKTLSFL